MQGLCRNIAHGICCAAEGGAPLPVLPLHKPRVGEDYLLGLFLGGVYQEVMGSHHNMLGSTHVVHVRVADCKPVLGELDAPLL